jgi:hypothetical protein
MLKNYTNETALQITDKKATTKKTNLSHTEKMALWGYLYEIYQANKYDWGLAIDYNDIYSVSMIQNDELRILSGDGIQLDDSHRLDSLFFNEYGVLCMSVMDENDNETIYC